MSNMGRFFKITFPDGRVCVVVSTGGFAGLLDLLEGVTDKDNTYVAQISFWEYIMYVTGLKGRKRRN